MHITVRQANLQDRSVLQHLFLASRRQAYTWMAADAFRLSDLDEQTQGETILVAEDERRKIVGFVSIWDADHFIHHLYVDSEQQRNGVGRALLAALPGWPDRKYCLKCLLLNRKAAAFYRACGWIETGGGTAEDGDYIVFESVAKAAS